MSLLPHFPLLTPHPAHPSLPPSLPPSGGFTIPINQMHGQVSGYFQLAGGDVKLPLKFKAWISPRGEEAPNYVRYALPPSAPPSLPTSLLACIPLLSSL